MDGDAGGEPLVVELPANAGPDDAEALATLLKSDLAGRPLHLNAEPLQTICAAYVMTLLSALETNADLSPAITVSGAGEPFVNAFTDLGFFKDMMRMEFAA